MADPAQGAPMPVFTPVMAVPGLPVLMPPGVPSIHLTQGAVVWAGWASVFTFAIVSAATYVYYVSFPKDRLAFKLLVAVVWGLSLIDTAMGMVWIYDWTVNLWGTIPGSVNIPHAFYVEVVCWGLSTLVVQFFYAWRIWTISQKQVIIPALVIISAITQLSFVIWVEATWGPHIAFMNLGIVLPTAYAWPITCVIGDFIITVSLFYYLRVQNKDSAASQTTRLTFNAIISRAVQANVFSLLSQVMAFVLFKVSSGMFFFLNDLMLGKIYCFSLLASLNARRSSNALFHTSSETGLSGQTTNGMPLSNLSNGRRTGMGAYGTQSAVVRITETVDVTTDNDWTLRDKKPFEQV